MRATGEAQLPWRLAMPTRCSRAPKPVSLRPSRLDGALMMGWAPLAPWDPAPTPCNPARPIEASSPHLRRSSSSRHPLRCQTPCDRAKPSSPSNSSWEGGVGVGFAHAFGEGAWMGSHSGAAGRIVIMRRRGYTRGGGQASNRWAAVRSVRCSHGPLQRRRPPQPQWRPAMPWLRAPGAGGGGCVVARPTGPHLPGHQMPSGPSPGFP
jgi:hypothetical protein